MARGDDPAGILAAGVDDVEGNRGAEVHHDRRRSPKSARGNGIGDPIGPDLRRVVVADRQPGLDPGRDDQRLATEERARELADRGRERWHDARNHHSPRLRIHAGLAQERQQQALVLVSGSPPIRRQAPRVGERLITEDAENGVGVADIDDAEVLLSVQHAL